jgi:hypothetical protein
MDISIIVSRGAYFQSFGDEAKIYVLTKTHSGIRTQNYQIATYIGEQDPYIEPVSVREVDAKAVESLLDNLTSARIPVIPEFIAGCDGWMVDIEIHYGMNSVKYSWWVHIPEQWLILREVVQFIVDDPEELEVMLS